MVGLRECLSITLTDDLKAAFSEVVAAGVALDFALFGCDDPHADDSHASTARKFLHARYLEAEQHRRRLIQQRSPHVGKPTRWKVGELSGRQITYEEFWQCDEELMETGFSVNCYRSAFLNPPYPLKGSFEEHAKLFDDLNEGLFGSATPEEYIIWSWSNQCSSYFDAGLQWWGAHLWTVSVPQNSFVTVIGASTSD